MGKLADFTKNKEPLKLGIVDYIDSEIDIINMSSEYYLKYWKVLKRPKEKKRMSEREFWERLYNFLWIEKVSELLIILYLEDLKGFYPTGYQLNKLLRRTSEQNSATIKNLKKLKELGIIITKKVPNSPRNEKQILINKKIVTIYGDDEFRQMMLDDWSTDAKRYIEAKLKGHLIDKEKIEKQIKANKKGRRVKK